MEQESIYKKSIAVIGCGAAGGFCSVLLTKNPYNKITAFDTNEPFTTLLPTGGGRCNITYSDDDIRSFVKNYPRGEKFLLSVFSKLDSRKTRCLFEDLGIKTYVQKDKRVFPLSNSSYKTVQILNNHLKTSNFQLKKEIVIDVVKNENIFKVITQKSHYYFNNVIIATGGNGFKPTENLAHNIIEAKPSLCALNIKEKNFYKLSGLCFKDVEAMAYCGKKKFPLCQGDFIFTHKSISGPLVFKLSALSAYENFNDNNPLEIIIKLTNMTRDDIENMLKTYSKKSIKNVFSKFVPESFISVILDMNNIDGEKQAAQIKKSEKEVLINSTLTFKIHAVSRVKGSEIVTAGGIDLKEINPKTMESKIVKGLYFIGEVLDIDGFTGGFNLQNCWSGAYVCSTAIN